ncbi:hypothetical protein DB347_00235 [Opitutaceae bacterium EW11]|nr:hypothetical protein DB347_00235 [Opitutaceae bacterium EW11]
MSLHRFFVLLASILALGVSRSAEAAAPGDPTPKPVSLTFIANEGVLIVGSTQKVLIDAPFTESYGIFAVPSAAVLGQIRTATPPFDGLTCILATHGDGDHISLEEAGLHLQRDTRCAFFAPTAVTSAFGKLPFPADLTERMKSAAPGESPTRVKFGDLEVTAVPVAHLLRPPTMPPPPPNVAHVLTIDGIRFAHTGDMGPHTLDAIRRSVLPGEHIDVMIVNVYFFAAETIDSARAILAEVKPQVVLLAHLGPNAPAKQAEPILKLAGFPRMIALDTPMQTYSVSREENGIRIEKR